MKIINIILIFILAAAVIGVVTVILAGSFFDEAGGVFISEDAGASWIEANDVFAHTGISALNIIDITFNRQDSRIVYLASRGGSLFKSLEGGERWIKIKDSNGILADNADINSIAIDRTRPDYEKNLSERLYVAVFQEDFGQILRSDDGGLTFRRVYIASRPNFAVLDVVIELASPNVVWAGTGEGLLIRSENFGELWEKVQEFPAAVREISLNPQNPNDIFVTTGRNGVFRSTDRGDTWFNVTPSAREFPQSGLVETVARDPARPAVVYLGTGFGLLRSIDGGESWSAINLVIPEKALPVLDVQFDSQDSSIIYVAAGFNIYKSSDAGQSWEIKQINSNKRFRVIAVDPTDNNKILVGVHKF